MSLKKSYTFLYMPADHGGSREFRLPRWLVAGGVVLTVVVGAVVALYGIGLRTGNSWWPGGSRFQRENTELLGAVVGLEVKVEDLETEINRVHAYQKTVAAAVDLPLVDDETFSAGVGGRHHPDFGTNEWPANAGPVRDLGEHLDQMLRQAKIQRQGYLAMIDTLAARETMRAHIPSIRPTDTGWLSSRFGFRHDPFTGKDIFHRGLDFSVPLGTEVRATGDGVVAAVQNQRGFGRVVKIDHGNGVVTVYAHLSEALVRRGDVVRRGEIVARSGNSGRSTAPHLHYEIRLANRPVNPLTYILDSYATRR